MKTTLICSILLNVLLLAALAAFFVVAGDHTARVLPATHTVAAKRPSQVTAKPVSPAPATTVALPFRWKQLDSKNDYRLFIANLRAAGCPENTVEDIVMGNVNRAFAWQRAKLKIDGSVKGPWSQASEIALINELLGQLNGAYVALSSQSLDARLVQTRQASMGQSSANVSQAGVGQVPQLSNPQQYPQYSQAASASSSSAWLAQGGTSGGNLGPSASLFANSSSGGQSQPQQSDANGQSRQNSSSGPQVNADPNASPSDAANSDPNSAPASSSPPYFSPNGVAESDDPYARSSQDIMAQQQAEYVDWFAQQAANSDWGVVAINPANAPQQ